MLLVTAVINAALHAEMNPPPPSRYLGKASNKPIIIPNQSKSQQHQGRNAQQTELPIGWQRSTTVLKATSKARVQPPEWSLTDTPEAETIQQVGNFVERDAKTRTIEIQFGTEPPKTVHSQASQVPRRIKHDSAHSRVGITAREGELPLLEMKKPAPFPSPAPIPNPGPFSNSERLVDFEFPAPPPAKEPNRFTPNHSQKVPYFPPVQNAQGLEFTNLDIPATPPTDPYFTQTAGSYSRGAIYENAVFENDSLPTPPMAAFSPETPLKDFEPLELHDQHAIYDTHDGSSFCQDCSEYPCGELGCDQYGCDQYGCESHCRDCLPFDVACGPTNWISPFVSIGVRSGSSRLIGNVRGFFPIAQGDESTWFIDLRAQFDDDGAGEGNFGLGWRGHLDHGWILGLYGYYDLLYSAHDNIFSQGTIGAELMSLNWEFRVNGYIAESGAQRAGAATTTVNGQIVANNLQERAYSGVDAELGKRILRWGLDDKYEFRWFVGGYGFSNDAAGFESFGGPRSRIEFRSYDLGWFGSQSRLTLGYEVSYDKVREEQHYGFAQLRIPLSYRSDRRTLSPLRRRFADLPVRDIDILTQLRQ